MLELFLALAEGHSYSDVMAALQTTLPTIARWKKRFEELGIDGLEGRHKGSQPRVATPSVTEKIASLMNHDPSYRKVAQDLALSKSTIQRICAQNHTKPHRLDRYMAQLDCAPQLNPNNIIGLYLHAPQHVAAFSVGDDIHDRSAQLLRTALDAGGPSPALKPRHTSRQFILFRDAVITRFPIARQIHFILDNPSAHKTMDVELFLVTHPHVHLHFLQSYQKWMDHVSLWFSEMSADPDSATLNMRKYLRAKVKSAEPFGWILGQRNH